MNIHRVIEAYYSKSLGEHDRERSWEHCYDFFHKTRADGLAANRDLAALHLAFYLASWGMYRGSSFLINYAYTVHCGVIDLITDSSFDALWNADFGACKTDSQLVPPIRELIDRVRRAYKPFIHKKNSTQPTDTLVTKIILGTFGCLPACDEYFIKGFKSEGLKYSPLNRKFIEHNFDFCQEQFPELREEQASIKQKRGLHYPLMKLVDMYFWQLGREARN